MARDTRVLHADFWSFFSVRFSPLLYAHPQSSACSVALNCNFCFFYPMRLIYRIHSSVSWRNIPQIGISGILGLLRRILVSFKFVLVFVLYLSLKILNNILHKINKIQAVLRYTWSCPMAMKWSQNCKIAYFFSSCLISIGKEENKSGFAWFYVSWTEFSKHEGSGRI